MSKYVNDLPAEVVLGAPYTPEARPARVVYRVLLVGQDQLGLIKAGEQYLPQQVASLEVRFESASQPALQAHASRSFDCAVWQCRGALDEAVLHEVCRIAPAGMLLAA
ncbi:hypothetical protein [Leeia aquatica]|uniref:Uncharacterized protein n=1 Tax=Leeia aquatica TaxID=2725557 RepID=A0A847S389_9NEIS|nr:hypothetical protein [Leeia aquatica]NLR73637.1 hypothetical protein [Leeia aquatica]